MVPVEVVIVPSIFGITGTVILISRWLRHRETMANVVRAPERTAGLEERMERIERALEAIAVEVERVGEGQRFVTKLLAEGSRTKAEQPQS